MDLNKFKAAEALLMEIDRAKKFKDMFIDLDISVYIGNTNVSQLVPPATLTKIVDDIIKDLDKEIADKETTFSTL